MINPGHQLTQCIQSISSYGRQIGELCETLNELLPKAVDKSNLCKIMGNLTLAEKMDPSNWVYTDVAYSLPLSGVRIRSEKREAYLTYQISLAGDGMLFYGNDEPLLHVNLWTNPVSFDEKMEHIHYPLEEPFQIRENRLLVWDIGGGKWMNESWTFSIRLLTLNSSQALQERIVEPAKLLIHSSSVQSALPDDLPGLVIYPTKETFNKSPDQSDE